MNDSTCACGMNRFAEEGEPRPFTREWHVAHRDRHLVAFPDLDRTSRANLDGFIEFAS